MKRNTVSAFRPVRPNYNGLLICGLILLFTPFTLEFLVHFDVLTGGPTKERTPVYSIMVFIALMSISLWSLNHWQKTRTR